MDLLQYFKEERLQASIENSKVAENNIKRFIKDYPIEKIPDLTMNEYLTAKEGYGNPESFCHRIRYDLDGFASMGNVTPDIFGIFLNHGTEITLSNTFERIYGHDYEKAFQGIKEEMVRLLENVRQEKYDEIEKCKINSAFKYRLIIVYFPEKFVPVSTKTTLNQYCDSVGIAYDEKEEMVYRNIALREWKESVPEIADWNNTVLMGFCDWLWKENKSIDGNALRQELYVSKAKEIETEIQQLGVKGETRDAIVKVRVNQGLFRDRLLNRYSKCCLCGVSDHNLLIASHIKPWNVCAADERLDVDNGFLMCPNHDKLFDQGFITFDNEGKIVISDQLLYVNRVYMNVEENMLIKLTEKNKAFLKFHRNNIFKR